MKLNILSQMNFSFNQKGDALQCGNKLQSKAAK
jgi:hypothetical protein